MEIYLARDNNQAGPFSQEQVEEMIRSGTVVKTDQLWHDGFENWRCFGLATEYSALFDATIKGASGSASSETQAASKPATQPAQGATMAGAGDSAPIPYNPSGVPAPKAEGPPIGKSFTKERELASRGSRLLAALTDSSLFFLAVWLLSACFLPSGLSLLDMVDRGGSPGTQELVAVENEQGQTSWELKAVDASGALSIGDRFHRGELTDEEGQQIIRFSMVVGIIIVSLGITQLVLLCLKGQTLGKMFLGIRIARDPSMAPAKFVHGVLLRALVPGLIKAVPILGWLFSIINILCIFGANKKCLHDRIASTSVVKA